MFRAQTGGSNRGPAGLLGSDIRQNDFIPPERKGRAGKGVQRGEGPDAAPISFDLKTTKGHPNISQMQFMSIFSRSETYCYHVTFELSSNHRLLFEVHIIIAARLCPLSEIK